MWRIMIFSDIDIEIMKKQRIPELYADEYSEDECWKLYYPFNKEEYQYAIAHPKPTKKTRLTRYILEDNYKHVNGGYINGRRPVLIYGDSFAACYSPDDCFDHILNNDEIFSKNYYLLNYGVGGYGLDEIYLLLKNSIDNYSNPVVIVSLMTLDLDRSILSFRSGPKPYFAIENNHLKLNEVTIYPDMETMFLNNKPKIISYFYRRIIYSGFIKHFLPEQLLSYLKGEDYYKKKKIQVNERIMIEIINELKSRNIDYVFLIFHPSSIRGEGLLKENVDDWRDVFIKQILHTNNIPYIWSKDIIFQQIKDNNVSLSDFFLKGDGHPTGYQRKLLAKRIKEFILNRDKFIEATMNQEK